MVSELEAPQSMSELHIWLATSARLASSISPFCSVDLLHPDDWRNFTRGSAAFLLVETEEAWEAAGAELDDLLATCKRASVPALLWITASPLTLYWLDRCAQFERVFSMDFKHLPALEAKGAIDPAAMWPATHLRANSQKKQDWETRPDPVLWLGGWSEKWLTPWRERLASVLRGAGKRGLRIHQITSLEGLPADLAPMVDSQSSSQDPIELLRSAKIVIGADSRYGETHLAPQVIFDAAAAGTVVITPHDFLAMRDFVVGWSMDDPWISLVPTVDDTNSTVEAIDLLLRDSALYGEVLDHFIRVVANNHTYAHRLATLASAAGYRFIPDAQSPAPA